MKISILLFVFIIGLMSCRPPATKFCEQYAKFEPLDGECILFVGQDLGAIGGIEGYTDGYLDHFERPAGFTMYTNLRTGDKSYGHTYRGLDGIWQTDNWGAGDCNMNMQLNHPNFLNMALAIGLELVNHEEFVASGDKDRQLDSIAVWLKTLGERPVFLRIGYEFDGHEWNNYNRKDYLAAYRYIKDRFDSLQVNNVAYVWQSKGWGSDTTELAKWYPGDSYVDWCAYSFFADPDEAMIDFARKRGKPVFIAEATPMFKVDNVILECDFNNADQAIKARDEWFSRLFNTIDENPDVVKAVMYINVNWREQAMWQTDPFNQIDSRLSLNNDLKKYWIKETRKSKYLKSTDELYDKLWHKK